MNKKPVIAIVAHDVGGRGGMETHLEEVITRLKRDYRVIVVAASMKLSDDHGVRFIRIPVIARPVPLKILLFSILATVRLAVLKRDILHTTGAIVFNRADVSTVHFCMEGYKRAAEESGSLAGGAWLRRLNTRMTMNLARLMERIVYRPGRTKRLVAVSNRVRAELLDSFPYAPEDIQVIPNGVDLQAFYPYPIALKRQRREQLGLPAEGRFLLFMGGDWQRKGLDYVLAAFNRLAGDRKDIHLLVVGRGDIPYYAGSVDPAFKDRVQFKGMQPNPQEWFGVSDIFLFPTSYETFSLVVHEAAAAGLTILSTKVGGVEDLIEHRVDGLFIERDAGSIESALREVLDQETSAELGLKARRKVENLTWDRTYQRFERLYGQIGQAGTSYSAGNG